MSIKKSLNNSVKVDGMEGEVPCPAGVPRVSSVGPTACRKWSKYDNKMAILCYLQVKEGPNIGYRKIMYQH